MTDQQTGMWAYEAPISVHAARDEPAFDAEVENLRRQMPSRAARDGYRVPADAGVTETLRYVHIDAEWDPVENEWRDLSGETGSLDDPDTNAVLVRLEVQAVKV